MSATHTLSSLPSAPSSFSRSLLGLVGWLALAFSAAAIGGFASIHAGEFYRSLARPAWAPPAEVFGPVWTILYTLMGFASWLVWRDRGFAGARGALALYAVQLAANALWSWLFFAWREGAWASAEIVVLDCLIVATVLLFWRIRPLAGVLLLPYLAWVSFATALAFAMWRLNPSALGGS